MGFACVRDIATESIAYTRKKKVGRVGEMGALCFFLSVVFWTLAIVLES